MKDQWKKQHTETELEEEAIKLLWDKNQYEDAIHLTNRLLKRKPGYPLYYLILSDCYKGIAIRDNDLKASEKSQTYWQHEAWAFDGKFIGSDYWHNKVLKRHLGRRGARSNPAWCPATTGSLPL